jgi:hypothetical protein
LRERAERTLAGERFQHYFVAVESGRLVGGYELQEGGRMASLVFEHVPLTIRALNLFLRVIPKSRELRTNSMSGVWFAPGRDDVAQALWRHASSLSAATGTAIGTQFDTRGPLRKIFPLRPWTPKGEISIAVRSPVRLSEDRLLSPP